MNQGSKAKDYDRACKDSERPDYQREDLLRVAYEEAGSIKGAAERFDASYFTVRNWLIEYGIHVPQPRESYSRAAELENIDVDDFFSGGRA